VSLAAVAPATFVTISALAAGSGPAPDGPLVVEVVPVALEAANPARRTVGRLEYLGGLWLRGADPRFGGFSDLRLGPDGRELVAVTDCGSGFTARLGLDEAGRLVGLEDARVVALTNPGGGPLGAEEVDAESLVALPGGELEVGFEGRARVQVYGPGFAGPARLLPVPEALAACARNGGLELMADAGDGRRLLVCEARRETSATVPAWIGGGSTWREREYPLAFDGGWAGEPFRPTGAARLPNGDLLIVERRFPPLAARLVRLPRASLLGEGPLETHEIARLEPPLTVDNFEGVEVTQDARGRALVYLLSDDNNCAKRPGATRAGVQRTLLLQFALPAD
jgi:hypothetical protein